MMFNNSPSQFIMCLSQAKLNVTSLSNEMLCAGPGFIKEEPCQVRK